MESKSFNFWEKLLQKDTHIIEMQNSMLAVIVGLVFMLNNGGLYNRFPDTYKWMEFAPDWFWGIIYFSTGAAHFISLILALRWWRKNLLFAKFGLWLFIAICVIYGDSYAVSGYFYLVFAVIAFRGFLRIQILKIDDKENACS